MNRDAVLASLDVARSQGAGAGAGAGAVPGAATAAVFHLLRLFVFPVLFCACVQHLLCPNVMSQAGLSTRPTAARHSAVLDAAVRLAARGTLTINPMSAYGGPPSISPPPPLWGQSALSYLIFPCHALSLAVAHYRL